jgi:NAD(P)-dependent dehydrogenase (short-subunit alcohol dehydrogenase family)
VSACAGEINRTMTAVRQMSLMCFSGAVREAGSRRHDAQSAFYAARCLVVMIIAWDVSDEPIPCSSKITLEHGQGGRWAAIGHGVASGLRRTGGEVMSFVGQVVFITGGGSGMGRLAAQRMADAGAKVAAIDINEVGLAETAEGREGIHTWRIDVTDNEAVLATVKQVEDRLGPIDRVYNAAAIMPTALLMDQDAESIVRVMEIDYNGVVHVAKAILPGMLERGRGDLINFASIAGWGPAMHFGAYNAAKFAVVAFSEVLHHENRGKGVRIIAVCPPPVATPLLDQATSRPKVLEHAGKPLAPGLVLDAIERDLAKDKAFCFPTAQAKFAQILRRYVPGLSWWVMHRIERH